MTEYTPAELERGLELCNASAIEFFTPDDETRCNDTGCEGEASHEFNGGYYCFDCWCEMTGETRG